MGDINNLNPNVLLFGRSDSIRFDSIRFGSIRFRFRQSYDEDAWSVAFLHIKGEIVGREVERVPLQVRLISEHCAIIPFNLVHSFIAVYSPQLNSYFYLPSSDVLDKKPRSQVSSLPPRLYIPSFYRAWESAFALLRYWLVIVRVSRL